MNFCFSFICQQGSLEIKACLLAASLVRNLRGDHELVAAIPEPKEKWGQPRRKTIQFLEQLGVKITNIQNRIDENYPISNKISCIGIDTTADHTIFLDTDILCIAPFAPQNRFSGPFCAKPADLDTFSSNLEAWQIAYDLFDLPPPEDRVVSTTSSIVMPPYFNAGVIAAKNAQNFSKVWEECCKKIDAEPRILNKRPWLDQIALSVAVAKTFGTYDCLDERYNFPAHLKPLQHRDVYLCHYHSAAVIRREQRLREFVEQLIQEHPKLAEIGIKYKEWFSLFAKNKSEQQLRTGFVSRLLRGSNIRKPYTNVDAIITGVPRSGTSYLCKLLHSVKDTVAINEPTSIFGAFLHPHSDKAAWEVALFHQETRANILDAIPIKNRLKNGNVTENTTESELLEDYIPQVGRADFLLCTKNTITYLSRLDQLHHAMPHAAILACIRNPLDTIASWKNSFPHLEHATVDTIPIGHMNDDALPSWQRRRLREIHAQKEEIIKRALFWNYLAEVVLFHASKLHVIHYEQLVLRPHEVMGEIFRRINGAPALVYHKPVIPSTVRQTREKLDSEEIDAIRNLCGHVASEFGYSDLHAISSTQ